MIPDWESRALRILAEFRSDYSRGLNDAEMVDLVAELVAGSALFADAWRRQAVLAREGGARLFQGPDGTVLRYEQHTFTPAEQPDHKLVMLLPRT